MAVVSRITEAEYLAREELAETKSEFIDGEIIAMAGASPTHSILSGRAFAIGDEELSRRGCRAYTSDVRVKSPQGNYFYPDASFACDPIFDGIALLNPTAIVEVLSPSTQKYDRGQKFVDYGKFPSLQEIVLISQDLRMVEVFKRDSLGWYVSIYRDAESALLASLNLSFPLPRLYDGIEFTS